MKGMYLYEKNETYTAGLIDAMEELKLSEPTIKRRRRIGIAKIMELYKSDLDNEEILIHVDGLGKTEYY